MITHVAIRCKQTGNVYSLSKPNRHHHLFPYLIDLLGYVKSKPARINGEQGFLDESGKFLDRWEAYDTAVACEQIEPKTGIKQLFSEDVW